MKISLTGDRPSGKLHLGHYVGSLQTRLEIQEECKSYILIADTQTMTDKYMEGQKVQSNIIEVMKDYLAVGLNNSTFCLQSEVLELYELSCLLMNYVSLNRLMQNPTLRQEIEIRDQKNLGFMLYPIYQVADILGFSADVVPVGEDQLPMIEQTNNIVNKLQEVYKKNIFKKVKPLLSSVPRLIGIDGKFKASKSLNNAIFLSDSDDEVAKKVRKMYTDPNHIKITDPGAVEGNVVFEYLDAFCSDKQKVSELKDHYQKGGLADKIIKEVLLNELLEFIRPIRDKREALVDDHVLERLYSDTEESRRAVQENVSRFKSSINFK